ncbi:hypothetical protein JXB12_07515 [candidate division KSB1 bacterium]|nr:hypothetical protein [candidate division KSB1 bacterium]
MKRLICSLIVATMAISLILISGCSRIEIEKPAQNEPDVTTPYTLSVKHTGCGTVQPETFKAWLDKDSDLPYDITNAFTYSRDTWTAPDFDLSMGSHTLTVSADVTTGSWCRVAKHSDTRSFFVAPCTDFVEGFGSDFTMAPDTIYIEYDATVLKIAQGESKTINLPDHSPMLVDGKLPVTVKFSLRNTTTKYIKFGMFLNHGGTVLYSKFIAFCGAVTVDEEHAITLSPSTEPLTLTIEAGDMYASPSDDTRAVFFNGKLMLRVFPN